MQKKMSELHAARCTLHTAHCTDCTPDCELELRIANEISFRIDPSRSRVPAQQGRLVGRLGVFVPQGKAGVDPFGRSDNGPLEVMRTIRVINARHKKSSGAQSCQFESEKKKVEHSSIRTLRIELASASVALINCQSTLQEARFGVHDCQFLLQACRLASVVGQLACLYNHHHFIPRHWPIKSGLKRPYVIQRSFQGSTVVGGTRRNRTRGITCKLQSVLTTPRRQQPEPITHPPHNDHTRPFTSTVVNLRSSHGVQNRYSRLLHHRPPATAERARPEAGEQAQPRADGASSPAPVTTARVAAVWPPEKKDDAARIGALTRGVRIDPRRRDGGRPGRCWLLLWYVRTERMTRHW